MVSGFRRALRTVTAGILLGAFGGIMVMLMIPPLEPLLWLWAVALGALGGLIAAAWVILQMHRVESDSSQVSEPR